MRRQNGVALVIQWCHQGVFVGANVAVGAALSDGAAVGRDVGATDGPAVVGGAVGPAVRAALGDAVAVGAGVSQVPQATTTPAARRKSAAAGAPASAWPPTVADTSLGYVSLPSAAA